MVSKACKHIPAIIDCSDEEAVRKAIEEDCQSVSVGTNLFVNYSYM